MRLTVSQWLNEPHLANQCPFMKGGGAEEDDVLWIYIVSSLLGSTYMHPGSPANLKGASPSGNQRLKFREGESSV